MPVIFLIGRLIFGAYWLLNAWNHLAHSDMLAGYAGSKNVPAPKVAVIGSGLLLLLGGLSLLSGYLPTVGIILLVIFLLGVTPQMHAYWTETDPQVRAMQQIQFRKNMALFAALLMLLSLPQPWAYSL